MPFKVCFTLLSLHGDAKSLVDSKGNFTDKKYKDLIEEYLREKTFYEVGFLIIVNRLVTSTGLAI